MEEVLNKVLVLSCLLILVLAGGVLAATSANLALSNQGTNVITKSTGATVSSGNLTVTIYDALSGGNLVYNDSFIDAIVNGSWNVMLGENATLNLDFGRQYFLDYVINGEDLDFTNITGGTVERQFFYAPLGILGGEDISENANLSVARVGIGTQTPRAALELTSPGTAGDILVLVNDAGKVLNTTLFTHNSGTNDFGFNLESTGTNNELFILNNQEGGNQQALYFGHSNGAPNIFGISSSSDSGTTFVPRFVVNQNGNVGIGTNSPTHKLNVVGTVNATSFIGDGSGLTGVTTSDIWVNESGDTMTGSLDLSLDLSGYKGISINNVNGGASTGSQIKLQVQSIADRFTIIRQNDGNGVQEIGGALDTLIINNFTTSSLGDIHLGTQGGIDMTIKSGGNIGMGTQNPGYKIEVSGNASFNNALFVTNEGKAGIGTASPGGTGVAKLEINGTDSSSSGPHIQTITSADQYPNLQILPWTHDNVALSFDSYWSGSAWTSSDAGSNFQIYKLTDKLRFKYNSGTAAGSAITWTDGIILDTSGRVGIGTASPSYALVINGSLAVGGSLVNASGLNSFAGGQLTKASGNYSFAFGSQALASGTDSFATGSSSATNIGAVAFGSSSASGDSAFAVGGTSDASGFISIAMGETAFASGNYSVAIGNQPSATSVNSVAIGEQVTSSGDNSFALGSKIQVVGNYSFGIGLDSTSRTVNRNNTFVVVGEGLRVGFGTVSPNSTLHIKGGGFTIGETLQRGRWHSRVPISNTDTTLDSTGDVGQWTSITIGTDGLPIISYYDNTDKDLKVAHCSDLNCNSAEVTILDSSGNTGGWTSITIGTDGLPIISYYDATSLSVEAAHCSDTKCTSATISTVVNEPGQGISITIGTDGLPIISYYDSTTTALKVAHCSDTKCTSATNITVDNSANVGSYSSIAIGSEGFPAISYYDLTNTALKIASCLTINCSSANITTLDSAGDVGSYTSITIGSEGLPVISYMNSTGSDLKIAFCNDFSCTSAPTLITVDSAGNVGSYTSISIGTDRYPIIAYHDISNSALKIAKCLNAACTTSVTNSLSSSGGQWTSITLGSNGLPIVSHYVPGALDFKVSACGNDNCIPYWTRR